MSIRLSIASAVYNLDENFLRAHIEQMIPQLTDETELLLIDDCSTNHSGAVCKEYANNYKRIRYINMGENGGLSRVRNRSIEEAQGEWIFFADGDDLMSAHFVETALHFIDSDADIIIHERKKFTEIVTGDFPCEVKALTKLPEGAGRKISISCMCLDQNITKELGMPSRAFYHAAWGALYRKAFLVNNHIQFPPGQKKAQDAVFNTEAYYYAEKIEYLPYIMYYYRTNPEGITRRYSKDLTAILQSLLSLLSEQKERLFANDADVDGRFQNHRVISCAIDNMRLNIFHKDNPKSKAERREDFFTFVKQEPYKTAIENFDAKTYNRSEWLLTINLIRKEDFNTLNRVVGSDTDFRVLSALYKRFAKLFR